MYQANLFLIQPQNYLLYLHLNNQDFIIMFLANYSILFLLKYFLTNLYYKYLLLSKFNLNLVFITLDGLQLSVEIHLIDYTHISQ